MTEPRRQDGRETWNRLLEWDKAQPPSERLASTLLASDGFSVDPSHPLGGRDGKKDAIVRKDGMRLVLAVYFPRGQQSFTVIEEKFRSDLVGVAKNSAEGIVFFTNQELKLGERTTLSSIAGGITHDLYHLERITTLLNIPQNYGIRFEFLQIAMTAEEMLALYAQRDKVYLQQLTEVTELLKLATSNIVGHATGGDSFPVIRTIDGMFALGVEGSFPLRSVTISIYDRAQLDALLATPQARRDCQSIFFHKNLAQIHESKFDFFPTGELLLFCQIPTMQCDEMRRFSFEVKAMNGWFRGDIFIRHIGTFFGKETFDSCTSVFRNAERIYGKRNYGDEIEFDENGIPQEW
jgi:hypothetical protein